MSDQEKDELTKKAYLEVQKIFKDEFASMKDWMQENFVCSKHCSNREANIDRKFIYVFFGLIVVGSIAGVDNLIPLVMKAIGL
jgi:hypothetical protein